LKKHLFLKILVVVLLLAAAVGAVCVWRWNIFFGATTERSYSLDGWPHAAVMTAGENGLTDRSLSWRSSVADTCYLMLQKPDGSVDTIVSAPQEVVTMGGEQYRHVVRLTDLADGDYSYSIHCANLPSLEGEPFTIGQADTLRFCCFGDLLMKEDAGEGQLAGLIRQTEGYPFDAILYTGNIIQESTHQCWAGWYRSMQMLQAGVPQLGVPGSRDYEHGIHRDLDPRWKARFPMPLNGPERFLGTTYYIDYPNARLIFLDTEDLEVLSDYTVLQCWLARTLKEVEDRWKIVVMHHPVHSASAGFDHPRLYTYLHKTLDDADLIFEGNDLTYGRRADISLSDIINEQHTVPVYTVLTSDSTEAAVPKCSPLDQRIGSNRAFFCTLSVTKEEVAVRTRYMAYPDSIYDGFNIHFEDKVMHELDSLPAEVIEMPAAHADGGIRARRFEHLRDARVRHSEERQ